jgi:YidC/Oxa1 family membrane protein insertase
MDNKKSLILFIVLAAFVMGGWFYLQQVFPPAPPAKKGDEIAKTAKKDQKKDEGADKKDDKKDEEKTKQKQEDKKQPPAVVPQQPVTPTEETIGGGDDYYIEAVLTSRGAGVRRLTLPRFKAANWLGRPEDTPLQLIQDDPEQPSFRLYHFPDGNGEASPLLGLGEKQWKLDGTVKNDAGQEVTFSTDVPGAEHLKITKVYRLEPHTYHLSLTLRIQDTRPAAGGGAPTPFRYQFTGGQGLPIEGEWYTSVFRNAVVALVEGNSVYRELETSDRISHRSGGDKVPLGSRGNSFVQYAGVMNQYFGSLIIPDDVQPPAGEGGGDFKQLIAWARPTLESTEIKGIIRDINEDRSELQFVEIGGKTQEIDGKKYHLLERVKEHLKELDLQKGSKAVLSWYETPEGKRVATWIRLGSTPRPSFDDITVRVNSERLELKPGQTVAHRYLLYHGPVKTRLLGYRSAADGGVDPDLVRRYTDTLQLSTLTDYSSPGWAGKIAQKIFLTDVIVFFTIWMHRILWLISLILPSSFIGLSIVLLTVLVRGLMFPISRRQALFSIKMQELAPEMKKLQEKYKDDPQAKTQAMMELYRKHKVHPLGMCLPLFLQMPIFMGLYFALQESIQFRLAPFLWIQNLAAPDMLLWWTQSIPFISDPDSMGGVIYLGPYLNLLPIIAVVLMVVQQKLMTPPAADEQQEQQQKMMRYMSIFFGVLFYKVAAGLCIYFISSSLWGLAERRLLPRKKATPVAAAASANGPPVSQVPRGPRTPRGPRRNQPKKPEGDAGAIQKLMNWWAEVLKQAQKK